MSTESLYWASGQTFTLTNGTGAGTDIDDDPDSPDANWVTGSSNAIDLLVGFTTPSGPPTTGTNNQQFRAYIRQGANGPSPDWAMDVYENGTLRASAIATGTITNGTGGELVTGNWTFSGFTNADGSGVEIKIRQTAGSRDVDVGAVEWVADYYIQKSVSDTLFPYFSAETSTNLKISNRSDALTLALAESIAFALSQFTRNDSIPLVLAGSLLSSDTFTDTNGTALGSHTPNIGSGWTAQNGTFEIQSNEAITTSPNVAAPGHVATLDIGTNDYEAEVVVNLASGASLTGFALRYVDNDNMFWVGIRTNGTWAIQERNGGGNLTRDQLTPGISVGVDYTIRVRNDASTGTITAWLNGGLELSWTSANFLSSTVLGIRSQSAVGSTFDNWQVRTGQENLSSSGTMLRSDSLLPKIDEGSPTAVTAIFGAQDELFVVVSETSAIPFSAVAISSDPFDNKQTNITLYGSKFGTTQGTGKVEVADSATYATANKEEQTVTYWDNGIIQFTGVVDTLGPSDTRWIFVTTDAADQGSLAIGTHRAHAFTLYDSANVPASPGTATTPQLTPPAGKTTGDHGGGRLLDDTETSASVNLGRNQYREDEWAMQVTADAILNQTYEFRLVLIGTGNVTSTTPYTISVTPTILINVPAIPKAVADALRPKIDEGVTQLLSLLSRQDALSPKIDELVTLISYLSRSDNLLPKIDEIVTLIVSFAAQDELLPRIDSLVSLLVSLARADAITPKIDEFVDVMNVTLSRNDSLPITIIDLMSIYSAFTRDDALVMATTEVMAILSRLDRTDSLVLTSEEILKIFSFIVGRYRWRDDDGTETTATWLANEDTDVNRGININTRLRIQVDTSGGDTGSVTLRLQYRKTGDPDWEWRDVE